MSTKSFESTPATYESSNSDNDGYESIEYYSDDDNEVEFVQREPVNDMVYIANDNIQNQLINVYNEKPEINEIDIIDATHVDKKDSKQLNKLEKLDYYVRMFNDVSSLKTILQRDDNKPIDGYKYIVKYNIYDNKKYNDPDYIRFYHFENYHQFSKMETKMKTDERNIKNNDYTDKLISDEIKYLTIDDQFIDKRLYDLCMIIGTSWFQTPSNIITLGMFFYELDNNKRNFRTFTMIVRSRNSALSYEFIRKSFKPYNDNTQNKRINEMYLKSLAGGFNSHAYNEWKERYQPKIEKVSKKQEKRLAEEVKDTIVNEIVEHMSTLDHNIIRDDYEVEFNDIGMAFKPFEVKEIAELLFKTTFCILNSGEPCYFVKEIVQKQYRDEHVNSIKYKQVLDKMLKDYTFEVVYQDEIYEIALCDVIKQSKTLMNYRSIVNEPYGAFEQDHTYLKQRFNLFNGFVHKYDPNFVVDQSIVDVWLNHIKNVVSNNNNQVYEFLLKYFTMLIKYPQIKSGIVLIVKGDQGSGKNATFDIFNRYVLGIDLSITTSNMDQIIGTFNSLKQGMLLLVLDEAVNIKDKKAISMLKNMITQEEQTISQKYKDPIRISDKSNYVLLTNDDFSSIVEETDRRILAITTNNDYCKNGAYFNKYFSTLGNNDAGKHIFHYLLNNVQVDRKWNAQNNLPSTDYKLELKTIQASPTIKYLIAKYNDISLTHGDVPDHEFEMNCKDMFCEFNLFCTNNGYRSTSIAAFGKMINRYVKSETIDKVIFKKYSINSLKKSLHQYLIDGQSNIDVGSLDDCKKQ